MAKGGITIGSLKFVLGLDGLAFAKGADAADKRMKGLQKSFRSIGSSFQDIGAKLSLGITAPVAAFGIAAGKAASDAAELQGSFDQTFGASADTMNKWAEQIGNALGRSTQEMQKAANTFGIFFNTAVPRQKADEMSQTFAKLAQDLGSFYNVDTETAIEKLRSGLSGESEPLRDFGVFLSEAAVKAEGLRLGLTGVGDEFTEQEKIIARYNLILEATKNAQGDVERTSGGTANQVRRAQAAFEELQVTIGTKLLPVVTPLIEKLADALTAFSNLPEPVRNITVGVTAFAAAVGPVAFGIGGVIKGVGTLLPALTSLGGFIGGTLIPVIATIGRSLVGLAIAGGPLTLVASAVGAGYLAWQNWDKIGPIVQRAVGFAQNLYTGVKSWISDRLNAVWDGVVAKIQWVADKFRWLDDVVVRNSYVPDMVDSIGEHIARLQTEMVDPALAANDNVASSFASAAQSAIGSVQSLLGAFKGGSFLDKVGAVVGIASQIGKAIAGFRADGGPVQAGKTYMVGERGPELFTAPRSGMVTANENIGGGGRPYFDLRGAVMTSDLLRQMNAIGDVSSYRGAAMGSQGAQTALAKRGARRLA